MPNASALPYFIALLPQGELHSLILDRKNTIEQTVGKQLYLSDPPHLTVFLAYFQDRSAIESELKSIVTRLQMPAIRIDGWNVFEKDVLTGNNTLTLKITEPSKEKLRAVQQEVLEGISPLRDPQKSQERYAASWDNLNELRRESVLKFGFPFTGPDWQPHFTIASIRPLDWLQAWERVKLSPVEGTFAEFKLALFALDAGEPVLLSEFELETA